MASRYFFFRNFKFNFTGKHILLFVINPDGFKRKAHVIEGGIKNLILFATQNLVSGSILWKNLLSYISDLEKKITPARGFDL